MSSSLRYNFFKNTTGAAITDSSVLAGTDGDDKQEKFLKRILTANDVGNGAGAAGHASGLILATLPKNYTVLMIQGLSYRPEDDGAGVNQYSLLDNTVQAGPLTLTIAYKVGSDGTIRLINTSYAAGAAARFVAGDIVTVRLVIGTREDTNDIL